MIVSITDQLAIVCPTVIPKYSLTSQNPASLTCEKNSDPAPTARASSATVGRPRPSASRAEMPAAALRRAAGRRGVPGRGVGRARSRAGGQPDAGGGEPAQDQRRERGPVGPVGDEV